MTDDRVVTAYLIETPHSLEHAAEVIAGEQSSGTFVSVPGETVELKERYGARVERIEPRETVAAPSLPGSKPPRSAAGAPSYRRGIVHISFPLHNFGPSLPALMSTVAGNLYELQELSGVRLLDLELPAAFARSAHDTALRLAYAPGSQPGLQLFEPASDWRGYHAVLLDVTNPGDRPLPLVLRIADATTNWATWDRLNRALTVPARSRITVRVPMAEVEAHYRYHVGYRDAEHPGGQEEGNLRFLREFDCGLLR